jgi:type IV pilus assembly protein PilC
MLKLPVLGLLLRKISVARFCRTLSTLIASAYHPRWARHHGAHVWQRHRRGRHSRDAEEHRTRRTISAPLKETNVFPSMVTQMISVGEATGALDAMLAKIADFYEEEVDVAVAGMLTLLEPIMIAFLGTVVGGIVIAMYMPIFDMISKLT